MGNYPGDPVEFNAELAVPPRGAGGLNQAWQSLQESCRIAQQQTEPSMDAQRRLSVLQEHSRRVPEILTRLAIDDDLPFGLRAQINERDAVAARGLVGLCIPATGDRTGFARRGDARQQGEHSERLHENNGYVASGRTALSPIVL